MGEKSPYTVKLSKFFISLLSYVGLMVPTLATLHMLNQPLKVEIPIVTVDINRPKNDLQPIEPEEPELEIDGVYEDDGDYEEEEDGEDDEFEEGEEIGEEEEEIEELEEQEPEPEEEEKEPENSEENGSQTLNNDGTLSYEKVAEWVKASMENYRKNEQNIVKED